MRAVCMVFGGGGETRCKRRDIEEEEEEEKLIEAETECRWMRGLGGGIIGCD